MTADTTNRAPNSEPSRMPRLLLVDDEPAVLRGLRRLLTSAQPGWQVDVAQDGNAALELARTKHFDVVITDLNMPTMSGVNLLSQLAKLCPDTIRVAHSSHVAELGPDLVRYLAHNVLEKPATAMQVLQIAKWAVELARERTRSVCEAPTSRCA